MKLKLRFLKLRSLKLMLLLFILPLQMLAAELGEAGKLLATLPGVSDVETLKSTHFPEKYVFFIKQQLDAKDASKGSFEQRVILCHRGFDRPTVLVTEGYNAKYALREGYIEELSKLFDTNIITVEYRYFDKSMPSPCTYPRASRAGSRRLSGVWRVTRAWCAGAWSWWWRGLEERWWPGAGC